MASNYIPLPWKKNFRKIPSRLIHKIRTINSNDLVVACVKKIKKAEIQNGLYKHLNISLDYNGAVFPSTIVPSPKIGSYSNINVEGKEIKRKDLPMITKTFAVDTPNFGDWSYGSHTVYFDREVYYKEYIPPKYIEIKIELMSKNGAEFSEFLFKLSTGEVLNKTSDNFVDDLLFNLNLLQENAGNSDIYASEATFEEYIKTIYVNWEILPIGDRETDIKKFITKFRLKEKNEVEKLIDRYDVLTRLKPKEFHCCPK